MSEDLEFFSLDPILSKDATYNFIFGERSNGKTYSCLKLAIKEYVKFGRASAYVRRWDTDFKEKRGPTLFNGLVDNRVVTEITNGKWSYVFYHSGRWYLAKNDDKGKRIRDTNPFAYAFSVNNMEHDKSASFPDIWNIIFDEVLTRGIYLANEFVLFMNVVSTIVRHRVGVKIFMLGNTVNKYCPYFPEMGIKIKDINSMKPGDIRVYQYGEESELRIAVQYADAVSESGKPSDVYFAFDNPRLKMITSGAWEVDMYPHCPVKYKPKDIMFKYYISFSEEVLEAEIVECEGDMFTFIHRKTTELQYRDEDIVFQEGYSHKANIRRRIDKPLDKVGERIYYFFKADKVFYQSNDIGEIVRNYLIWCKTA